jgi:hypothetical protein
VYEQPWTDTQPLARDCLCSSSQQLLPFTFVSTAHVVELRFVVTGMNASDDFNNFNFEGSWEFIRTPVCARKQRLSGASGEINFRSPSRTPEEVRLTFNLYFESITYSTPNVTLLPCIYYTNSYS